MLLTTLRPLRSISTPAASPRACPALWRQLPLLALGGLMTLQAQAIEIWHSNTVFGGQGQCVATLTLDSGLEEFRQVKLQAVVLDKAGRRLLAQTLDLPSIGSSSAERFAEVMIDGEALCDEQLQLQITSATAVANGKRIDLLRAGQLTARTFRPMPIRISTPTTAATPKPAAPTGRVIDLHLTSTPQLTQEGIHIQSAEGRHAMYAVNASEAVWRSFQKARAGQCLRLHVGADFNFSDASSIQRIETSCR
ncbi:MAG: IrmA family protein [Sphaerotilus sulfidivorans]|uniref:IrmA family protein n=1 Tax=Sphaerotilus sulfidivorans TaxID=639200 RepID=UPI003F2AE247